MKSKYKIIRATCSLCGSTSSFDESSIEGQRYNINGINHVLCICCEDDLRTQVIEHTIGVQRLNQISSQLMSDERDDLLSILPPVTE